MNTKDMTLDNLRLYILLYAASGGGKTWTLGTFREAGPMYVFDFDEGMTTLMGKDIEYDIYKDNIVNGVALSGAEKMDKKLNEFDKECPFSTLCLDSLTTYSQSRLLHLCKVNNHPKPTLHEYGLLVEDLRKLLKNLPARFPDKHIIVTAHEELVKDEIMGTVTYKPLIVGKKLPGEVPVYFQEMYRLKVEGFGEKSKYTMLTSSGANYDAKSRLNLPPVIDPTYSAIMTALKGMK